VRSKLIPRNAVHELGERLRAAGKRISFANGCFEILHVGHVRFLESAKEQGDVLVVGVNSDRSVSGLKGEGRPLLGEDARAELVASLACVDYAVIFDDRTAEPILRDLRPDVQCKGPDYTEESVPERWVMDELGGVVRIVGDPKDHSTRDLLTDIARRTRAVTSDK
jgi:D-glycero-beta-D-manno-heptose 1-phosphate adenylyltransferase